LYRWVQLAPRVLGYKLFRTTGVPKLTPANITVSVTNQCNSKCKMCNIWRLYRDNPGMKSKELSLGEFDSIFENLGRPVTWFNISGGEPYLNPHLVDICKSMYENCNPRLFTIPTNGLLTNLVEPKTKDVLDACRDSTVIVNLSLDGVGSVHDEIRGVQGNFDRVLDTFGRLKALKAEYPNLKVGVNSVVSKFNINRLLGVYEFVKHELNPDEHIFEIAELRSELFNWNEDITPDVVSYQDSIQNLHRKVKEDSLNKPSISRIIQAFRLEYYNLTLQELKLKKQIIPCYAGFASCHISPYGDVWPCCILAYNANMGNLRQFEYKFHTIWRSARAEEIRKMIKAGLCYCPLANAHYTNMLCDPKTMFKVARNVLSSYLYKGKINDARNSFRKIKPMCFVRKSLF